MVAGKNNKTNIESKLDSTKEVFIQNEAFENGLDEIDIGNLIQLAQAISEEGLENTQNEGNNPPLAPIEANQEESGNPLEDFNNIDNTPNEILTTPDISVETLEGNVDGASPQEVFSQEQSNQENLPVEEVGPDEIILEGAPEQGFSDAIAGENTEISDESGPEEDLSNGAPVEEDIQTTEV